MKYTFNKTMIVAEAQSPEENMLLLSIRTNPAVKERKPHKKHRKHNHKKECPECGQVCKGLRGLSVHMSTMHKTHSLLG